MGRWNRDEKGLTPRERQVYDLLVQGETCKEIGYRLELSTLTVKVMTSRIYHIFKVDGKAKLIVQHYASPRLQ